MTGRGAERSRAGGPVACWLVLLVAVAACGDDSASGPGSAPSPREAGPAPTIVAADFSTTVDNPYFPLNPGTRMVYEGTTADGLERVVVDVTRQTRQVMGVQTVVVHDVVSQDGEVVEDTYDWYAQHRDGSVWYFGEQTEELEDGEVVSTEGAWEAGVDGAEPGIVMLATPEPGAAYRQEHYAGVAEDAAEVLSVGGSVEVPLGSFDDVLTTKDYTPLEPDVLEHKSYAPGIGLVLEVDVSNDGERIALVAIEKR